MFRKWLLKKMFAVDRGEYIRLYKKYTELAFVHEQTVGAVELMVGQQEWEQAKSRYKMRAH